MIKLSSHQRSQQGFTLVEILVAMAIFALIAVGATQILTRVTDSNQLSGERFVQLQELQRAMLIIERDFMQMVPRKARIDGEVSPLVIMGGEFELDSEATGIAFVRSGWQNPQMMLRRSTQQGVAYRLREGNLERLHGNYVDNAAGFEPKVRVLLQQVSNFSVQLLEKSDQQKFEWSDNINANQLPQAVAVTIESDVYGVIRREFKVGV